MQTRFSSVVLPAFALPITRMRKWVYIALNFSASSGFIGIVDAVGVRSARGEGLAGSTATAEGAAMVALVRGIFDWLLSREGK